MLLLLLTQYLYSVILLLGTLSPLLPLVSSSHPSWPNLDPVLYEPSHEIGASVNSHTPELPFNYSLIHHIIFSNVCVYPFCFLNWQGWECT